MKKVKRMQKLCEGKGTFVVSNVSNVFENYDFSLNVDIELNDNVSMDE